MTSRLEIYYEREQGGKPIFVSSEPEIDGLLDRVRAAYENDVPVLMEVTISGSVDMNHMLVGVSGERGVIFYSGPGALTSWSLNKELDGSGVLTYYYFYTNTDFPSNAEVSLELVKRAVCEFLDSGGQRPESVAWQPYAPRSLRAASNPS